jgi:hypothetical protein
MYFSKKKSKSMEKHADVISWSFKSQLKRKVKLFFPIPCKPGIVHKNLREVRKALIL